jgi:hypothetical protein
MYSVLPTQIGSAGCSSCKTRTSNHLCCWHHLKTCLNRKMKMNVFSDSLTKITEKSYSSFHTLVDNSILGSTDRTITSGNSVSAQTSGFLQSNRYKRRSSRLNFASRRSSTSSPASSACAAQQEPCTCSDSRTIKRKSHCLTVRTQIFTQCRLIARRATFSGCCSTCGPALANHGHRWRKCSMTLPW